MTRTAHATTAAPYTATGIDLQLALRWTHRCHPPLADAPMRSKRVTEDSNFAARCSQRFLSKPNHCEGDAPTTEVIESTFYRGGTNNILISLCCFARFVIK
jgi:hypothetical protein